MGVITYEGATFAVGTAASVADETVRANWEADIYTTLGEMSELPEMGDNREIVTRTPLSARRAQQTTGQGQALQFEFTIDVDFDDDGQQAVLAAFNAATVAGRTRNFRIRHNDDPGGGAGSKPTEVYIRGEVAGWRFAGGGPNTTRTAILTIAANLFGVFEPLEGTP